MKISTGKTARAIRRREIISRLMELAEKLHQCLFITTDKWTTQPHQLLDEHRRLLLELTEITAIDANTPTRARRRT